MRVCMIYWPSLPSLPSCLLCLLCLLVFLVFLVFLFLLVFLGLGPVSAAAKRGQPCRLVGWLVWIFLVSETETMWTKCS